ncbi:MAG: 16S rRNA (guanine(527)-N(7))-methyltransferase RsmG [Chromatiaceae bacterium]|nr:MAG: 16S rRNA (guanine(527)-N(7))-methyltransferase RsmG [Chromatiaceae bacterium]
MTPVPPAAGQPAPPDPNDLRQRLDAGLAAMDPVIGAALDVRARAHLIAFIELLWRWNRAFNLTAVRDPVAMIARHLLDSLAVLPWVDVGPVLDAGTGAGLPGIPLALARPDLPFVLLDSNGKKTRFVRQAALELGLTNVAVVQTRLATYRPPRKFATILARALARLPELYAATAHLAAPGGRLLALKGPDAAAELAALQVQWAGTGDSPAGAARLAGQPAPRCYPLSIPALPGERNLILIPFPTQPHG